MKKQPAPGAMTRQEIERHLRNWAAEYVRQGFEPEVAIAKAGADLRKMRSENFKAAMAEVDAFLKPSK